MNGKNMKSAALAGVCVAMAAGTAAYVMADKNKKVINSKKMKRTASKAMRAVGDAVDSFSAYIH
ncbi:MAG: hypothetical protein RSB36_03965 [Hydrogenoanaerobacterium sp.]